MECTDCKYYSSLDGRCDKYDKECEYEDEAHIELCFVERDEK